MDKSDVREVFAAIAMLGLVIKYGNGYTAESIARESKKIADAMIEALKNG